MRSLSFKSGGYSSRKNAARKLAELAWLIPADAVTMIAVGEEIDGKFKFHPVVVLHDLSVARSLAERGVMVTN